MTLGRSAAIPPDANAMTIKMAKNEARNCPGLFRMVMPFLSLAANCWLQNVICWDAICERYSNAFSVPLCLCVRFMPRSLTQRHRGTEDNSFREDEPQQEPRDFPAGQTAHAGRGE